MCAQIKDLTIYTCVTTSPFRGRIIDFIKEEESNHTVAIGKMIGVRAIGENRSENFERYLATLLRIRTETTVPEDHQAVRSKTLLALIFQNRSQSTLPLLNNRLNARQVLPSDLVFHSGFLV